MMKRQALRKAIRMCSLPNALWNENKTSCVTWYWSIYRRQSDCNALFARNCIKTREIIRCTSTKYKVHRLAGLDYEDPKEVTPKGEFISLVHGLIWAQVSILNTWLNYSSENGTHKRFTNQTTNEGKGYAQNVWESIQQGAVFDFTAGVQLILLARPLQMNFFRDAQVELITATWMCVCHGEIWYTYRVGLPISSKLQTDN